MYLHIPLFVPPCTILYRSTILYHLVPLCTVQVQGSTYQYIPVCTAIGIFYVGTSKYWYVPFWGFSESYGHVSSKVRTGTYQYIPPCTALYQVYRIPDVQLLADLNVERIKFQSASANLSRNYNAAIMSKSLVFHCLMIDWNDSETSERIGMFKLTYDIVRDGRLGCRTSRYDHDMMSYVYILYIQVAHTTSHVRCNPFPKPIALNSGRPHRFGLAFQRL